MARNLTIEIIGDDRSYRGALRSSSRASDGFGSSLKRMAKLGVLAAGAAGVGALIVTLKTGFEEIMEGQKVMAQTNAAIKSTGGIANVTAKHVDALATSQSRLTGIDDELVQVGENLLLTFKNVRNEVGAGNAVFDRATKSALDLSVAGFGSVESAAKMMGKALNDPIKGMTALGRAGVTFSQEQKEAIKALVDTGHELEAQKLILKEVESQVGGSAKAYGETLPGQLAKAKNAFGEVSAQLTTALLPSVTKALEGFTKFMSFVQDNWPRWKAAIVENSKPVIEVLTRLWAYINANVIPVLVRMGVTALEVMTKIARVFQEHGPEIRRIIERVTAAVEPLIKVWLFLLQNVVIPLIKPYFTVVIPTALRVTITVLDAVTGAVEGVIKAFTWIGENVARIAKAAASGVVTAFQPVITIFNGLASAIGVVVRAIEAVISAIGRIPSLPNLPGLPDLPGIPGFQHGVRNFRGGMAVVGEAGPELVNLPRGANVIPHGQMAAAGAGGGTTINVHVAGSVVTAQDLALQLRGILVRRGLSNGGGMLRGQG